MDVAIEGPGCLKRLSLRKKSAAKKGLRRFNSMAKILIGISILLTTLSFVFGFLNTNKVNALRNELVVTSTARGLADRGRATSERKLRAEEQELSAAKSKAAEAEAKALSSGTELSKAQSGQAEAEARVRARESETAELQKRVAEATAGSTSNMPSEGSPNGATAALDDLKQQLDAAEQEKSILADKVKTAQDRVASLEEDKRRRGSGANPPGVHGTVLAINQAYNFVVLGIGDRQGVVPNSEMLVLRDGSLIGKIRISSVEPTTSIGDIITSSLARGVQVQPGDTVVYAGSTNS